MDNKKIEILKREQRQTRIIGIVLLCVGYFMIILSSPMIAPAMFLFVVGLTMTVRSFVHRKFAVLRQKDIAYQAQNQIEESPMDSLMTSQLVALSLYASSKNESAEYHDQYIARLNQIGINHSEAEKLFAFERDVIKKFNKQFLTDPNFTKNWFFNLQEKSFQSYPQEKEDILKEHFFTMSELCKVIDEAEWHVWNSHDKNLSEGIWEEIWGWRIKRAGGEFAVKYLDMIVEVAGVSEESVDLFGGSQGRHLSKYKWQ